MNKSNNTSQIEINYNLLKSLKKKSDYTQRELADKMDISLGKLNYCLSELVKKGFVKVENFKNSNNKVAYLYNLTPQGIEEKVRITYRFLKRKMAEYRDLEKKIKELEKEVKNI